MKLLNTFIVWGGIALGYVWAGMLWAQTIEAGSLAPEAKVTYSKPSAGGGGGGCPADGSPTLVQSGTAANLIANSDDTYIGCIFTNGPTSTNLCKVRFNLTSEGSNTGGNMNAMVFALSSGNINPAAPLGNATFAWSGSWAQTDVIISFGGDIALAANTPYAVVYTGNGGSGTLQWARSWKGSTMAFPQQLVAWNASGTLNFNPGTGNYLNCALYLH